MSDDLRYGRPERAHPVYDVPCCEAITGWRREHAARVWQAMAAVAVLVAIDTLHRRYSDALYDGRWWGPVQEAEEALNAACGVLESGSTHAKSGEPGPK